MRQCLSLAIGVRITKSDDSLVDVDDLAPLLQSTSALLARAQSDSLIIDPSHVRKAEHSLTLASLDGIIVFLACGTEETADGDETRYLVQSRRAELGTVFGQIMESSTPPSHRYGADARSVTALFLLVTAFQAAQQLVLEGRSRSTYAGYFVEASYLRVANLGATMAFEMIPAGVCRSTQSDTVH